MASPKQAASGSVTETLPSKRKGEFLDDPASDKKPRLEYGYDGLNSRDQKYFCNSLKKLVADLSDMKVDVDFANTKSKLAYDAQMRDWRAEKERLKSQITSQEKERRELTKQNIEVRKQRLNLKIKNAELEKENNRIKKDNKQVGFDSKLRVKGWLAQKEELEDHIDRIMKERNDARKERNALKKEKEHLRKKYEILRSLHSSKKKN